jgi:two-component system, LytTR family, response regulator LytT
MKKILIVEDEKSISNYIKEACYNCFDADTIEIKQLYFIDDALTYIESNNVDILLLDLNLNNADGFDILKKVNANSFFTIIISAHKEKAVEAFEFGVIDFVPKPFREERLKKAFDRCDKTDLSPQTKYLTVKKGSDYEILHLKNISYFEAADVYVEAHCTNGKRELLNQSMKKLELILPENFIRIHRSFIVDLNVIKSYSYVDGGRYEVVLNDATTLPLSRTMYKELKKLFHK